MSYDSQVLNFIPSTEYTGVVEFDMYTEHYVYVGHDAADSAYVSWRVIENTCPNTWDFQLCDWQHCYSGMPNTGNMNGIPAAGQGYLRLIVNPYQTMGEGYVHFWVFPTGNMDAYTDVYVQLGTPTSVSETMQQPKVVSTAEFLQLSDVGSGHLEIYDLSGRIVYSQQIADQTTIPWMEWKPGAYLLVTPRIRTTILKP
ncbi:MAG: T9SS type A sorting domain-containing protein [Flavobacteriales bacterium]